ncbi:general transcription factor IIIA, b [Dunckerocampus dactyliophorus]|uniref:general transcription factor IIIA, b n=1 Tax=Dunckerocampus dactyliophorus TaxID=161453 RepID=UPI0024072FB6|nr:general transcription factor IIIA, b [Dunckerocampus dactyliophorus]
MGERLKGQKGYVCSFFGCKAQFTKSWKLEAHLCKHTGLKPFSCESCDKSFCTRYQLTRHELHHSGEKRHKCHVDGCSEAFGRHASLKKHIARVHQHKAKRYNCNHPGCIKDFSKKFQLKAHMGEHEGLLLFHCKVNGCAKDLPSLGKLKHHENMHKGYPCEEELCPFLGKTWSEYQKHRTQHRVKLPCQTCKKQFNNAWFLRQHELQRHTGGKRCFPCPKKGCGKTFTRRFNLDSHVLGDHEGKKPFSCAYAGCGKRFAMKRLHPRKTPPWSAAQARLHTAETNKLAAKLYKTNLDDPKY